MNQHLDLDTIRAILAGNVRPEELLVRCSYQLLTMVEQLADQLDGIKADAAEKFVQGLVDETRIKALDFRNGRMSMDLDTAREISAAFVAAARTMLGDAPNYTETKVEFDVKVAESPELYTLVVQRHAPGCLTPHEARQKAERERDAAVQELERVERFVPTGTVRLDEGRPEMHDASIPPGGWVCAVPGPDGLCGMPVESEPCTEHYPDQS